MADPDEWDTDDNRVLASSSGLEGDEVPCWIVWERAVDGGRPHLRAIDTNEARADRHAAYLRQCARSAGEVIPDVLIEESKLNHLYAQALLDALVKRENKRSKR